MMGRRRLLGGAERVVFLRLVFMNLSKLNRILAFCEAEIKNEFREPVNPLSTLLSRFGRFLSKTNVFESDSGDSPFAVNLNFCGMGPVRRKPSGRLATVTPLCYILSERDKGGGFCD